MDWHETQYTEICVQRKHATNKKKKEKKENGGRHITLFFMAIRMNY